MKCYVKMPKLGRREEKRAERRAAIVAIAGRSFLENGYAGTTMSAICCAVGGSKGTLWSYFASKEDLFAAFLDEVTGVFRVELIQMFNTQASLSTTLEGFCLRFLSKVTSPQSVALYRLIVSEAGRSPEVGRLFFERGPGVMERLLSEFLGERMANGTMPKGEPQEMARFLLSMCIGFYHHRVLLGLVEPDPTRIEQESRRITQMFLKAFVPDEAQDTSGAEGEAR